MQALADLTRQVLDFRPALLRQLQQLTVSGTPAMRARGRKLLAELRKRLRNSSHLHGWRDARMTIESAESSTLSNAAVELLWRGDVIGAIKVVRQERNLGLKEAKDLVDAYIRSQPSLRQKLEQAQAEMWQKLKRGLLVALIFAAAVAYFFFQSR